MGDVLRIETVRVFDGVKSPHDPRDVAIDCFDPVGTAARADVEQLWLYARAVVLRRYVGPLRFLHLRVDTEGPVLSAVLWVPHRDTGAMCEIFLDQRRSWSDVLAQEDPARGFATWVREIVAVATDHELDEVFMFAGERMFDPHAGPLVMVDGPSGAAGPTPR